MKKFLLISFTIFSLLACANNETKDESGVIKKVGKEVITEKEVQKELENIGIKNDESLKKDVIESLTIQKILKQEAEKQGLNKEESYKAELKKAERVLLASMLLEKDVYQKVSKDEELLKKYFDDNKNKFDFEQVKIAHIVIKNANMNDTQKNEVLKKAQGILDRVLKGENFYELARQFSEAPDAKWGGEIGYISKGDMVTQIENVAFENPVGIYNKVVETIYGYEIILIIDKKGKTPEYKDLNDADKNELKDLLLNDYYINYIKNLKKEYGVEK